MSKLLIIAGPTGTGKTALALTLAQKYPSVLLSADSRQVYRGMDIGTGKDIPQKFEVRSSKFKVNDKNISYYTDGRTKLFGLDLVDPNETFSVSDFIRFAIPVITATWKENKIPIIVGGTGLYIRALLQKLPTIHVPQNLELRKELAKLSVQELQTKLMTLDKKKYNDLNNSDRSNSRRLIRAIEIATDTNAAGFSETEEEYFQQQKDILSIGLTADEGDLVDRIERRVKQRLEAGSIKEIKTLLNKGYTWDMPAMSGLGYRIWRGYFEKTKTQEEIVATWIHEEVAYAKRQLTWFKKEAGISWFTTSDSGFREKILDCIEKWYT